MLVLPATLKAARSGRMYPLILGHPRPKGNKSPRSWSQTLISFTGAADHFQAVYLNVAGFLLAGLPGFFLFVFFFAGFRLEGACHGDRMPHMLAQLYRRAAEIVEFSIGGRKPVLIGLVTLLQAASDCLAAALLRG